MKTEKKFLPRILFAAVLLAATVLIAVWFVHTVTGIGDRHGDEGLQNLENSLRRAAASCYAIEGAYPPSLDYLTERYGIQIDYERYYVFYDIFAENLMPDITVVEQGS